MVWEGPREEKAAVGVSDTHRGGWELASWGAARCYAKHFNISYLMIRTL